MGNGSTLAIDSSERESEMRILLAKGLTNAEIAKRLSPQHGTVRSNVSAIIAKLDSDDCREATILAVRCELVVAGDWN
jgi:DNA-binding NarL/FixJ family response regulator